MKHMKIVAVVVAILFLVAGGWWLIDSRRTSTLGKQTAPIENKRTYPLRELAAHNVKKDCWTIINGSVYDITSYVNRHPGGEEILRACGQDATTLFTQRRTQEGSPIGTGTPHSPAADEQLSTLKIGTIE